MLGGRYYLPYCGSQRCQPRSDSCYTQYKVAIGNCLSCPGGLLTFQRRAKGWAILSNPISGGNWHQLTDMDCASYQMLWIAVEFWSHAFCSKLNQVQKSDSRWFQTLHQVAWGRMLVMEPRATDFPTCTWVSLFPPFCASSIGKKNGIAHAMLHLHCYFCFQVPQHLSIGWNRLGGYSA